MRTFVAVFLAAMFAFVVYVIDSQSAFDDTATLTWTPPTQNTDGSPLTDLAAHKVYRSVGTVGQRALLATVPVSAGASYVDEELANGEWCYVVTAVRATGAESVASNQACKTIDTLFPNAPTGLSVE